MIKKLFHGIRHFVIGIISLVLLGEMLIVINEYLLGEQAIYHFDSDRAGRPGSGEIDLPGPSNFTPSAPDPNDREKFYRYLTELYAPVVLQKLGYKPQWDIPLFIDFDGNIDPRDNIQHEPSYRPLFAGVYGEVTAETEDAYYLLYSFYRAKDYDHPIRELITNWTYHDNDNEGFMIRVEKKSGAVTQAEGWFHNRFFLANETGDSNGSEPMQGRIYVEDKTHIIIYGQSMGHGMRMAQSSDFKSLGKNVKILRFRGDRPAVPASADRKVQVDCTYDLQNLDRWYFYAVQHPLPGTSNPMFEGWIDIGKDAQGKPLQIARYIAGIDYSKFDGSRPKPPWSWDDHWDNVPIFVWHFFPAYAFKMHFGISFSQHYLYNRPVDKTFGMDAEQLYPMLAPAMPKKTQNKWKKLFKEEKGPTQTDYFKALGLWFKKYLNHLWVGLG